jgi:ubiquinone/menaquinone biosynthesis C-methylase UbiE
MNYWDITVALDEVYRVLRPGGVFIAIENALADKETMAVRYLRHAKDTNIYSKEEIYEYLQKARFIDTKIYDREFAIPLYAQYLIIGRKPYNY